MLTAECPVCHTPLALEAGPPTTLPVQSGDTVDVTVSIQFSPEAEEHLRACAIDHLDVTLTIGG